MITFQKMTWSNFFSYGKDNSIDFLNSSVTQLLGLNGCGKTSIPIILQEVLYGKNVKKIAKANLLNRNIEDKELSAEVTFSVDQIVYKVTYKRKGAKLSLALYKDNTDISSHTAPTTLKSIENILRMDFDTFSQLVYQSSKSSLEFLTATDTQRKKFLITLFNLGQYTAAHEIFKKKLNASNLELKGIQGRYALLEEWIAVHSSHLFEDLNFVEVLNSPDKEITELKKIEVSKDQVGVLNTSITKNNTYKDQRDSIDVNILNTPLRNPQGLDVLQAEKISLVAVKNEKENFVREIDAKSDKCPTCKQLIDIGDSKQLAETYREEIDFSNQKVSDIITKLEKLNKEKSQDDLVEKTIIQFEALVNLIDEALPEKAVSIESLNSEILELETRIQVTRKSIKDAVDHNTKVSINNAKKEAHLKQLEEYNSNLEVEAVKLNELTADVFDLDILKDAFGTNGLVSYKLEYLTKDLEAVINEYLQELSRGRFQISFILTGEKLNVEVLDRGSRITINEVSEGELAKINVSTLLAIRKLMQNLSNTKLNLLFLDEIFGVLDNYGREDLINILLEEEVLNTFLVTHEYRHPLVPIINVTREEGDVSRITYD